MVFPSAYVALPSVRSSHGSRAKSWTGLRIASAGPWHNLALYAILAAMASSGLNSHGRLWVMGGYGLWQDVHNLGPVVLGLMPNSPLKDHIPLSSTVAKLDDTLLGGSDTASKAWEQYLTGPEDPMIGWCVSRGWFKG
ncbi:hypothetical protein FRB98_008176 [Tulasnella sp. 332]|nr:hypothetical protein FRB98_008176 [Tulasnella sp. 332]